MRLRPESLSGKYQTANGCQSLIKLNVCDTDAGYTFCTESNHRLYRALWAEIRTRCGGGAWRSRHPGRPGGDFHPAAGEQPGRTGDDLAADLVNKASVMVILLQLHRLMNPGDV